VVATNGQLVLAPAVEDFYESVEWEDDLATRIRPLGPHTEVTIDPLRQFGTPTVRSVPTEVIAEQFRAGDPTTMIASLYELTVDQIEAALRYEMVLVTAA
jgi:uncharacterized protein (DUF433 family)